MGDLFETELPKTDWADGEARRLIEVIRESKFVPLASLQRLIAHELRIIYCRGGVEASRNIAKGFDRQLNSVRRPGDGVLTLQEVTDEPKH